MPLALGIDVGSVAVKLALVEAGGWVRGAWSRPILGHPSAVLADLLAEVPAPDGDGAVRIGLTGNARDLSHAGLHGESDVVALACAIPILSPDARSAIEIGGHASRYVALDPATHTLRDYGLNQQCAAGSGSFFEQQATRLGMTVDEFARVSADAPRGATVAGRCSVFAKSDMIHLQQKGTPVGEIAYGLCLAMARNFMATVLRGRELEPPILIAGGGAMNRGLVRALVEILELDEAAIRMSPWPGAECAVGAAASALAAPSAQAVKWADIREALALSEPLARVSTFPRLDVEPTPEAPLAPPPPDGPVDAFLGVDVGSVSTNLVLLSPDGGVYEGIYLPTRGRPIDAVGLGLDRIRDRFGDRLRVLGAAVTGSGRHLAGQLIGADLVKNEITCQLRGAVAIDPEVDTVFEIGGQDSKYIGVHAGRIVDFVMNKVCAAGTGSFLEEQAELLGVAIVDEFATLAADAPTPADLGCQCTVFMHSEVVAALRRGQSTPDICAGLAYSVARNYLDRVVAGRAVGRRVMFQGGVASNPAVVAAFRQILGVPVRVHPGAGVSGAIGAALLVREARPARTRFRGLGACRNPSVHAFECRHCANRCQVSQVRIDGRAVFFGDVCERYSNRAEAHDTPGVPDMMARWRAIEQQHVPALAAPRARVGIPRASTFFDMLPFWSPFFASLDVAVVVSAPTSQATLQAGLRKLPAETCLPIKLAFGHVQELVESGVERIFLPSVLKRPGGDPLLGYSCPYVQAMPFMVKASLHGSFLSPEVDMSEGEESFVSALLPALADLGVSRSGVARAYRHASASWRRFREQIIAAGREALDGAERVLVVIGKPYNVLDPYLNLNLFQHLRRLGVTAVPMWCLPFESVGLDADCDRLPWHLNRDMLRAARYCVRDGRLYPVVVSSFGCGPDAFTQRHLEQAVGGRPVLFLEFDEHRAEAGLVTRLEAFLDELNSPRRPDGSADERRPARSPPVPVARQSFVLPYFADHAFVFSGALRAAGHATRVLPPPSAAVRQLGEAHSSGKECHPYSLLTGDLVSLARSPRPTPEVFFFPGTAIPCLLCQYGEAHRLLLRRLGVSGLTVMSPRMAEMKELFGIEIGARLWRGLVAVDLLIKMVCATRPYERERGQSDAVHRQNLRDIETAIEADDLSAALTMATARLRLIAVDRSEPRPLVGVAGDIFTRINPVGNQDLFQWLEDRGCEVWPAPFVVDILDFSMRCQWSRGSPGEAALRGALMLYKNVESWRVRRMFRGGIQPADEPGYQEVLEMAVPYLGKQQNEVLILNVAKMVDFARRGADGILNAACFNCMLGTVSAAIAGRVRADHGGIPIANLMYSGVEGSQQAMLEAFLHQVKAFARRRGPAAGATSPPAA